MSEANKNMRGKVFSGLAWTFGERIAAQGVSFILSVILARILAPEEYGIIAMVMVFINIANVFSQGGFGEALVQKKDADEVDFSTMFYCSFAVAVGVYAILYISAPAIAAFYRIEQITTVLRVLSLKIVVAPLLTIQRAHIQKRMEFKKLFLATFGGTLFSGIIGIAMARAGFGVWALVAQYLTNTCISAVVLLFVVKWRPRLVFSKKSASVLMNFGTKMVLANLVNAVYNELRSIIIGKKYASHDLAYYKKGDQIPSLVILNIDTAISNVVFPAMAAADSKERLKSIGRRAMKTTSYIIFPMMIGLVMVAEPLIILLLTEKWAESIIFMQILCIYWMFQPIQTTNWQIIKAMGRSDLCLKLELLKKSIGVVLIITSMNIGVHAIAVSAAVFGFVSMIINIIPNKKLIGYSLKEQLRDVGPNMLASVVMGILVHFCSLLPIPLLPKLVIQILCGVCAYILISAAFRLDAFLYLLNMIKKMFHRSENP